MEQVFALAALVIWAVYSVAAFGWLVEENMSRYKVFLIILSMLIGGIGVIFSFMLLMAFLFLASKALGIS